MHAVATEDQAPRQQLAERVKQRRLNLGLSAQAAAERAGVSRQTWLNLESATRKTAAWNHAGIERVLNWEAGSVNAILAGGEPTPADTTPTRPSPTQGRTIADLILEINDLPVSTQDKLDAIHALLQVHKTNPDLPTTPAPQQAVTDPT